MCTDIGDFLIFATFREKNTCDLCITGLCNNDACSCYLRRIFLLFSNGVSAVGNVPSFSGGLNAV